MLASSTELPTGYKAHSADNDLSAETYIKLDRLGIEFTIYEASARLLRKSLIQATVGGFLRSSERAGRIVVRALQDITLDIRSGERVALLGHNGAGKTTLLRAMAGIYSPTTGTLNARGHRMPLFDIALSLDSDASGYENILIRGLLLGLSHSEIQRKVPDIAAFSGLGDFLHLPVRVYSSGMILRLLFAIATSVDAEILLMDEWIATGDQDFVARADYRLHELIDRSHILVFASHNLALVERLCTRAIIIESGRVVFDGSVSGALTRYVKQQQT
jgi:ABC-type polysaccharide/polyol phosphate transport system ATPase subunit